VLVPGLEQALSQDDDAQTLADDVRRALTEAICGDRPAIAKVAKSLSMSPRTMQRRLGELDTSYQDLLDDVRRQSARRLLASTNLAPGEVAFLLGFEEVNSFAARVSNMGRNLAGKMARAGECRARGRTARPMTRGTSTVAIARVGETRNLMRSWIAPFDRRRRESLHRHHTSLLPHRGGDSSRAALRR